MQVSSITVLLALRNRYGYQTEYYSVSCCKYTSSSCSSPFLLHFMPSINTADLAAWCVRIVWCSGYKCSICCRKHHRPGFLKSRISQLNNWRNGWNAHAWMKIAVYLYTKISTGQRGATLLRTHRLFIPSSTYSAWVDEANGHVGFPSLPPLPSFPRQSIALSSSTSP